jgi:hypothetical protein
MQPYLNLSGDSPIIAYNPLGNAIVVRYKSFVDYMYRADRLGTNHIQTMCALGAAGRGLSTYINQHPDVKNGYSSKSR